MGRTRDPDLLTIRYSPPPKMTNTITNNNAPKTQPKTHLDTEPFFSLSHV